VVQDTDEMAGNPLRVLVTPAAESQSTLYEDDGESLDYRKDAFLKRRFHQITDTSTTTIDVSAPEGSYRPAARALIVEAWAAHKPQSVSASFGENPGTSTDLPHVKMADFSTCESGWTFDDGVLMVKSADRFVPERFKILY
jgi:hypothetical protein